MSTPFLKVKIYMKTTLNIIVLPCLLLPTHASEQGNVIGSVRIYMCVQKKL